MLSALVRGDAIDRFSYMLLDPMTIQSQTFHYKAFDDKSEWRYDTHEYLAARRILASSLDKAEHPAVTFQPSKGLPISILLTMTNPDRFAVELSTSLAHLRKARNRPSMET